MPRGKATPHFAARSYRLANTGSLTHETEFEEANRSGNICGSVHADGHHAHQVQAPVTFLDAISEYRPLEENHGFVRLPPRSRRSARIC